MMWIFLLIYGYLSPKRDTGYHNSTALLIDVSLILVWVTFLTKEVCIFYSAIDR
jgi:hypothetical protein